MTEGEEGIQMSVVSKSQLIIKNGRLIIIFLCNLRSCNTLNSRRSVKHFASSTCGYLRLYLRVRLASALFYM